MIWGVQMQETVNDNYISIDEAAEYLGIKTVTLRNWIKKDESLPAYKSVNCGSLSAQSLMHGCKVEKARQLTDLGAKE
jgi:excisionase family DNA binding protein